jgi:hypothetical protein
MKKIIALMLALGLAVPTNAVVARPRHAVKSKNNLVRVIGAVEIVVGVGICSLLAYSCYHYNEIRKSGYKSGYQAAIKQTGIDLRRTYGLDIETTNAYGNTPGTSEDTCFLGCKTQLFIQDPNTSHGEDQSINPENLSIFLEGVAEIYKKMRPDDDGHRNWTMY